MAYQGAAFNSKEQFGELLETIVCRLTSKADANGVPLPTADRNFLFCAAAYNGSHRHIPIYMFEFGSKVEAALEGPLTELVLIDSKPTFTRSDVERMFGAFHTIQIFGLLNDMRQIDFYDIPKMLRGKASIDHYVQNNCTVTPGVSGEHEMLTRLDIWAELIDVAVQTGEPILTRIISPELRSKVLASTDARTTSSSAASLFATSSSNAYSYK